jgi:hypothetical protein
LREAGNGWVEEVGGRKQSLRTAGVEREEILREQTVIGTGKEKAV